MPQSAKCCLEWLGKLKCLATGLDSPCHSLLRFEGVLDIGHLVTKVQLVGAFCIILNQQVSAFTYVLRLCKTVLTSQVTTEVTFIVDK